MKVCGDLQTKSYDDNCHSLACLKQQQNSKNTITWYLNILFKLDEVTGEVSRRWTRVYLRFSTLVWLQILPKLSILISLALCVSTLHTTFGHTWPAFHWFHISDENKKRKWMLKFSNALHTLQLVISGWHGHLWGNIDFQCFMVSLSTTPWKLSCVWWKNYQMENWRCSAVQIFSEQDHYCGETSLDPGAGYETSPVGDLTFS